MLKELTVVVGGQIYAPEILDQKNIFIEGGKIKKISTDKPPNHAKIINADGLLVIPGLIDALVHGGGGRHTMTGDPEDVAHIARTHAKHGVTSVLMATSSAKIEEIEVSLAAIAHIVDNPIKNGANVLGSYVEGKFGCLEKCGAQNPDTMSPPNFEELHRMWEHSDGTLKVISIAPERDPDLVFTKHLSEQSAENYNDIVVALGHTNASYDLAKSAIDNGITRATHTFNGMSGMHHRQLGVLEAVLASDSIHAELNCDGQHVAPIWGKNLIKMKGEEKVGLVSDCLEFAGVPAEQWQQDFIWQPKINAWQSRKEPERYIRNGAMWNDVGTEVETLYGSKITLMEGLRNVIGWGIPLNKAVMMATLTPAQNLRIDDKKGSISEGRDADLVLLSPDLEVRLVLINGHSIEI